MSDSRTGAERIAQLEQQVERLEAALAQLALRHSGQLGGRPPQLDDLRACVVLDGPQPPRSARAAAELVEQHAGTG
jgi:hypothetical protein